MEFDRADVVKVLQAFDDSDWDEIHLSAEGFELHISTGVFDAAPAGPHDRVTRAVVTDVQSVPAPLLVAGPGTSPGPPPSAPPIDGVAVKAPSVGRFYRAPSPQDPPFVEVGDVVTPDTTVCILEVMKLMSRVIAGAHGRVVAIPVENGTEVEQGQALVVLVLDDSQEGV